MLATDRKLFTVEVQNLVSRDFVPPTFTSSFEDWAPLREM